MKRIIAPIIIGFVLLGGGNVIGTGLYPTTYEQDFENNSITVIQAFPNSDEYCCSQTKEGHIITVDTYTSLLEPGKPMLPSKTIVLALPPGTCVESLDARGNHLQQLPGVYHLAPTPPFLPYTTLEQHDITLTSIQTEWQENNQRTYSSDEAYPETPAKIIGSGTLRKYSYVSISIYPLQYHPASGRLYCYDSVEITIRYRQVVTEAETIEAIKIDTCADTKASQLFVNYDQIQHLYEPLDSPNEPARETYNYIILTTDELYEEIASSYFITWKNSQGYTIQIVTLTDPRITDQPGLELADQIRNFLREYYIPWGIEYVLIIGNYDTVPMKYCYPNKLNHVFNLSDVYSGEVPTDAYYADLSLPDTESWDSDGDGFYGEHSEDDPDFLAEVFVGRIPTNDPERVIYTLNKSVTFESDTSDWKNTVLDAGAICFFTPFKDGAAVLNVIETDLMAGLTISHYSEQEGTVISSFLWNALTMDAFCGDWSTGKYGIVNWNGHGWSNAASRLVRLEGQGDVWKYFIDVTSDLDDDYPSVVFAMSCLVGFPEPCAPEWPPELTGHLGLDLLTKPGFGASVGVVSATRLAYGGAVSWPTPPGGLESLCYEFNKNMLQNHETVGEAIYNAKFYCNTNCPLTYFAEYLNLYGYNLYGDPSLVREGVIDQGRPEKPAKPDGQSLGKIGKPYTFTSSTNDPENEQIYYLFDWGDNTDSGWLGPYNSGQECEATHTWSEKNTYDIRVKAKDIHGIVSDWSDALSVKMPLSFALILQGFFEKIFEQFPYAFPLLRILLRY